VVTRTRLFLLFLVSGASALVYEVVWSRLLGLAFGHTVHATATVLACTMGGMALGAIIGGKWADRLTSELRAYALLEVSLGAYALLSGPLLRALPRIYAALAPDLEAGSAAQLAERFLLAAACLTIPTTLMGATLPVLCRALARIDRDYVRVIGALYAVNTFGAAFGALLSGFTLLEALGIQGALTVAALGSFAAAGGAWWLGRGPQVERSPRREGAPGLPSRIGPARGPVSFPLLAIGVTGFTALSCEIIWTRVLMFYLGNSVYAFSFMLAVFLAGLSLGSWLVARWRLGEHHALGALQTLLLLIAIVLAVSLIAMQVPVPLLKPVAFFGRPTLDLAADLSLRLAIVALTMFLQPVLFGAVFPLVMRHLSPPPDGVGREVGIAYAVNTLGNILGAVGTGFLLLPVLGMRNVIFALAFLCAITALVLTAGTRERRMTHALAGGGVLILLGGLLWILPGELFRRMFEKEFGDLVFYEEGLSDTVMVSDSGGTLRFDDAEYPDRWLHFSDRRGTAGTRTLPLNVLSAQIPALIHPRPKEILVIAFGSGNTAGSAATHPGVSIDAVDLSPEVFHASPFFPSNGGVHANRKVKFTVEDGRSFLLTTRKRYDVITLEPPFLDMAGVVNLYTSDFYRLARSRLKSDGVLAQWFPLYTFSPEEAALILRTFIEAFPSTTAWEYPTVGFREGLLVGGQTDQRLSIARLEEGFRSPEVARDLARIGIRSPVDFLSLYLFSGKELSAQLGPGGVITDDRSIVDFSLLRTRIARKFGLLDGRDVLALVDRMSARRRLPPLAQGGLSGDDELRLRELQRPREQAIREEIAGDGGGR